ncbi:Origin recognition complex subunit 2 [Allomyces javanicus]|nr:Origin recognition complex subunit 2 [Allomyces javanicus]
MPPRTPRQPAKRSAATTPDNAATRTPTTTKTPTTVKPRRFDIGLTDMGPKSTYSSDAAAAARAATPQRPEDLRFEDEGDELEWDFRYKRHKATHVPDGDDVDDDDDIDLDATPRPRPPAAAAAPVTPARQGFAVTRSVTTARSNMMKVAADLAEGVAASTSPAPAPAPAAPTPARTPKASTPTRSAAAALAAMASPSLAKTRPLSRTGAVPGSPASPTPARKTSARHRAATPAKPASVAALLSTAASRAKTPRHAAAASDDEVVESGPEEDEEEEEEEDDDGTVDPSISLLDRAQQLDHAWEQNEGDGILSLFFESQTGGSKTSDNTLASLPQLAHQEYVSLLHSISVRSAPAIAHLQDLHVQCFPQWRFELHEGYNLLFFGVGSKRTLADRFVHDVLAHDGDVVTVAGFHPLCSVKSVLSTLSRALDCASPATLHDHVAAVAAALDDREDPLFLVVHNIDAPGLRADRAQTTLAQLASHANVRVVATTDHIHAALQWDYLKLARFNWLPHHVATFAPYHVETAFENTLMVKPGVVTAQSARTVLQSLPPNSRECFRILATHVLGKGDQDAGTAGAAPAVGMSYQAWFSRCREQFLVSEEANFRTIVTEFKDHQMVATRRVEGVDMLAIPLPPQAIESVLESMA